MLLICHLSLSREHTVPPQRHVRHRNPACAHLVQLLGLEELEMAEPSHQVMRESRSRCAGTHGGARGKGDEGAVGSGPIVRGGQAHWSVLAVHQVTFGHASRVL